MDSFGACDGELLKATYSDGENTRSCSESESLSDIDNAEVDSYLNTEKEKYYKKIIWEKLNLKYLQEQEAKKIAADANVPKPKKERQKKAKEVKKAQPAVQTSKKRASSRVNYDVLSKLLDEPSSSDNPKRCRTESNSDQNVGSSSELPSNDDELGTDQNEYDEDDWEENPDYSYYDNQEEEFGDYYVDDDIF